MQTFTEHLVGTAYESVLTIDMTCVGAGINGPADAQVGLTVKAIKDNWWSGSAAGEVDGLYVVVRQGGTSDSAGLCVDAQTTGTGFVTGHEYVVSVVDAATNRFTFNLDVQSGAINAGQGNAYGMVATANVGAGRAGVLVQTGQIDGYAAGTWQNALQVMKGGVEKFAVSGDGDVRIGGCLMIPFAAGAPSNPPITGTLAMQYDTVNHKLWIYDPGLSAWKGVALT